MTGSPATQHRLPVVFISDLGPFPAVDTDAYTDALGDLGRALPRPRCVAVLSGHYESRGAVAITSHPQPPIIYDYYGFAPRYYEVRYPHPGHPEMALRIKQALDGAGIAATLEPERGLDHGAWAPLSRLYPAADVPMVQLSLPTPRTPRSLLALGQALAPLREEGLLLVGAGAVVHNLRLVRFDDPKEPDAWAAAFATWVVERLDDPDALAGYETAAPDPRRAVPTSEHFDPLLVAMGASLGDRASIHFQAMRMGSLLQLACTWGASS